MTTSKKLAHFIIQKTGGPKTKNILLLLTKTYRTRSVMIDIRFHGLGHTPPHIGVTRQIEIFRQY